MARAIGIDIGGTKVLGCHISGDQPTGFVRQDTSANILEQTFEIIETLAEGQNISAIAIGVPGAVAPDTRAISLCPNVQFPDDFADRIEARFGAKTYLENDVNLAAFSEVALGSVCFVSVGTGIGLGTIIDGRLVHGHHGLAGEIGSLPIHPAPNAPTLEDAVGSVAIAAKHGRDMRSLIDALPDDPVAAAVVGELCDSLSWVLRALQLTLDPAAFVLGGGIGTRPEIAQGLADRLINFGTPIRISQHGANAGAIGAALYANSMT